MSDLTHDAAEDGFQEIQLTGKQLVFLFMAASVVCVAIFLFGVMVGRGVNAARGDDIGSAPLSTAGATGANESAAPPHAAEPPSPPAEDEFSYHERLQGSSGPEPVTPAAQTAASPPPPASVSRPVTAGDMPDVPTSGHKGTWVVQVTALQNRAAAAGIVQRLIGRGYPAFLENPASGAPVIYRVRIGRYAERREADQIARRLEKEEQFSPVVTR